MHDHGIRPGRHEEGVQDVGLELGALGDGAGHDGARRGRELRGRSGTGESWFTACDVDSCRPLGRGSMQARPGCRAMPSREVAHRPLEEEQVVLVVREVVPERKVPRADEGIVVGHSAGQERVCAWLVCGRGLVTKCNCICNRAMTVTHLLVQLLARNGTQQQLSSCLCKDTIAGTHIRISRRQFQRYTRPPG